MHSHEEQALTTQEKLLENENKAVYSVKERKRVLIAVCCATFLANSAYSSIAPFFPAEAKRKGVDPSLIGFIFSSYGLAMFFMSPVTAILMNTFGRKFVLILGCFLEVSCYFSNSRALP